MIEFATTYRQDKYLSKVQEVHYDTIHSLMASYENFPDATHRRVLEIPTIGSIQFNGQPTTLQLYNDLHKKHPDCILNFIQLNDLYDYRQQYDDANCGLLMPVNNYGILHAIIKLNISDVVITEPLIFDIITVSTFIKDQLPQCRIHINPLYQPFGKIFENEDPLHHAWVLPQHIYLYEDLVDVVDIIDRNPTREQRLLNLYVDKEMYHNLLEVLFNTYDSSAPTYNSMRGDFISDDMALKRMTCNQKCLSTYPPRCHFCDTQRTVFHALRKGRHRKNELNQPATSE